MLLLISNLLCEQMLNRCTVSVFPLSLFLMCLLALCPTASSGSVISSALTADTFLCSQPFILHSFVILCVCVFSHDGAQGPCRRPEWIQLLQLQAWLDSGRLSFLWFDRFSVLTRTMCLVLIFCTVVVPPVCPHSFVMRQLWGCVIASACVL